MIFILLVVRAENVILALKKPPRLDMSPLSSRDDDSTRAGIQSFPFLQLPGELRLKILGYLFAPWSIEIRKRNRRVFTRQGIRTIRKKKFKPYKLSGPRSYLLALLSVSKHFAALVQLLLENSFTGHMLLYNVPVKEFVAHRIFKRIGRKKFKWQPSLLRGQLIDIDWAISEAGRTCFPDVKVIDVTKCLTKHGHSFSNSNILDVGILGFLAGAVDDDLLKCVAYTYWLGTEEDLRCPGALLKLTTRKTCYFEGVVFNPRVRNESIEYAWPGNVLVSLLCLKVTLVDC